LSGEKACTGRGGKVDLKVPSYTGVFRAAGSKDELTEKFVSSFTDKWMR
jgi:hypothetical protein